MTYQTIEGSILTSPKSQVIYFSSKGEACPEKDEARLALLRERFGVTEFIAPPVPPLTKEEIEADIRQVAILELSISDTTTIRVLEDLVELLCQKNHISYSELPLAAQEKLNYRKEKRMIIAASDGVTAEEETTYQSNSLWATIKSWFGF